eukprot:m.115076 g.115076  ORF g.115076 m.115076 type:complete len:489 (-) comp14190_c0_seq7:32-1498(-)
MMLLALFALTDIVQSTASGRVCQFTGEPFPTFLAYNDYDECLRGIVLLNEILSAPTCLAQYNNDKSTSILTCRRSKFGNNSTSATVSQNISFVGAGHDFQACSDVAAYMHRLVLGMASAQLKHTHSIFKTKITCSNGILVFNVDSNQKAQCSALDDLLQNISTSASNVATTSDTCVSVSDPSSSHGKRRGNAVAAIVASVVSILLLLVVGIILAWVRHKRRSYEGDGKDIPIPVMATNPSIQINEDDEDDPEYTPLSFNSVHSKEDRKLDMRLYNKDSGIYEDVSLRGKTAKSIKRAVNPMYVPSNQSREDSENIRGVSHVTMSKYLQELMVSGEADNDVIYSEAISVAGQSIRVGRPRKMSNDSQESEALYESGPVGLQPENKNSLMEGVYDNGNALENDDTTPELPDNSAKLHSDKTDPIKDQSIPKNGARVESMKQFGKEISKFVPEKDRYSQQRESGLGDEQLVKLDYDYRGEYIYSPGDEEED